MKDRKHLILLIIFLAFFAIMLPMVSIPVDIGEHTYTGGIYDPNTKEKVETVTVTMSGKHVYSLTRDQFDLNGHIVIEAETFQNESDLGMYIDESLDGWFYGWCSFGANNYNWNGYKNDGFAYRKNYSALVIDLQKDDCTLYLSAVEDPAEQMPHDALTDFLTAMGWQ